MDEEKRIYIYSYPMFSVAVDVVLVSLASKPHVLLVRRLKDPDAGKLALPGGFVNIDEAIAKAAERELYEETGIVPDKRRLHPFGIFDDPGRDPRGRVISHAYLGILNDMPTPRAGDDAKEAMWVHADATGGLALDHNRIVQRALVVCTTVASLAST